MEELPMPKITKYGGHTNAGLTERSAGFVDTTASTLKTAKAKTAVTVTVAEVPAEAVTVTGEPPFDPAEYSVADVLAVKDDYTEDEWGRVLDAERNGKNRSGILK